MSEVASMPENSERNANLHSDLRRARAIFWEKYHGLSAVIDPPTETVAKPDEAAADDPA